MELKLVPVKPENKDTLTNLYQFYEYDFSKYTNRDVNRNGKYEINLDFFGMVTVGGTLSLLKWKVQS